MEIIWFKIFSSIALAAILLKRSVVGPQKVYARSCVLMLLIGFGALKLSGVSGDVLSWIGGLLLCGAITLLCIMLLAEIHWLLKKRTPGIKRNS